jgi:hypothetical protein
VEITIAAFLAKGLFVLVGNAVPVAVPVPVADVGMLVPVAKRDVEKAGVTIGEVMNVFAVEAKPGVERVRGSTGKSAQPLSNSVGWGFVNVV